MIHQFPADDTGKRPTKSMSTSLNGASDRASGCRAPAASKDRLIHCLVRLWPVETVPEATMHFVDPRCPAKMSCRPKWSTRCGKLGQCPQKVRGGQPARVGDRGVENFGSTVLRQKLKTAWYCVRCGSAGPGGTQNYEKGWGVNVALPWQS